MHISALHHAASSSPFPASGAYMLCCTFACFRNASARDFSLCLQQEAAYRSQQCGAVWGLGAVMLA